MLILSNYSNMNHPDISIIVTAYNTELYIQKCIESILVQTFENWELIIVDDGSIDNTSRICYEMAEKDSRVKLVHKENTGQADSRNLAIEMSQGRYVSFLDSDDWVSPNMYETLFAEITKAEADMAVCSFEEVYRNKTVVVHNEYVGVYSHKDLFSLYFYHKNFTSFVIWGMLIRKDILTEKIPHLSFCEDTAIILHWINGVQKAVITDFPFYHYRMRKSSLMHKEQQMQRTIINLDIIRERHLFSKRLSIIPIAESNRFTAESYLYVVLQYIRGEESSNKRKEIVNIASKYLNELSMTDLPGIKKRVKKRLQMLSRNPIRFAWQYYLFRWFHHHEDKGCLEDFFD